MSAHIKVYPPLREQNEPSAKNQERDENESARQGKKGDVLNIKQKQNVKEI